MRTIHTSSQGCEKRRSTDRVQLQLQRDVPGVDHEQQLVVVSQSQREQEYTRPGAGRVLLCT